MVMELMLAELHAVLMEGLAVRMKELALAVLQEAMMEGLALKDLAVLLVEWLALMKKLAVLLVEWLALTKKTGCVTSGVAGTDKKLAVLLVEWLALTKKLAVLQALPMEELVAGLVQGL